MRESGKVRLKPNIFHKRYSHLIFLRKRVGRWIDLHIKDKNIDTVIDMGCGDLPYKELIEPYVQQFIGVDIPSNKVANEFVDLKTNKTKLKDEVADLIWSVQVLEHVENPSAYLQECNRLLKPGKKLLLSTHGHWIYHPDPSDYWRWTHEGLKKEIENSGFKVIEIKGMMGLLSMSFQLFQDACLIHFPFVKIWQKPFILILQSLIYLAERYTDMSKTTNQYRNKDACVFFVVAEKINL